MKKTKFLLLVSLLLIATTLFSSCGSVSSVNKYLNEEFVPTEDIYDTATSIAELLDTHVTTYVNDSFVVLSTGEATSVSYKIFSLASQKVIATFTDSLVATTLTLHSFELYDDCPVILVKQSQVEYTLPTTAVPDDSSTTVTPVDDSTTVVPDDTTTSTLPGTIGKVITESYYLYDSNNLVKTTKYEPADPFRITYDTLVFDYTAYTIDTDGVLEEKVAVPEYVVLDSIDYWNDDYYYSVSADQIAVYDHAFNIVSTWIAPAYIYDDITAFVLNNGNILVQYTYEVDEDQKKYDITLPTSSARIEKHDLVSLIVDAKDGKAKEVELNYLVMSASSNYSLNNYYTYIGEISRYNDKFENIATIAPIVNKNVDTSEASCDIVFMDNNGSAGASLKLIDNQSSSLAYNIGSDRYYVSTLTGSAIIDAKGNVIQAMNNDLNICGTYLVGERAIYDFDFEVAYNLAENRAEVIATIGNSVFVKSINDAGYSIVLLCNGEQKTIYTYANTVAPTQTFEIVDEIGYVLIDTDPATNNHAYYNAENDYIVTIPYSLDVVAVSSINNSILFSGEKDGHTVYVSFSISDED